MGLIESMAKVDTSGLRRKVAEMERAGHRADIAAVRTVGAFFIEKVVELTPKDTNRAANGWLLAGRSAGVTHTPLLPYQPSSRSQDFYAKLEAQVRYYQNRVDGAEARLEQYRRADAEKAGMLTRAGRPYKKRMDQPHAREIQRRLRKDQRLLRRAEEELEKARNADGGAFIFFDADGAVGRKQNRRLSTVRNKIYGGTGEMVVSTVGVRVIFENLEPHIRIIERHPHLGHPVRTAYAMARSAGMAMAQKQWFEAFRGRQRLVA